MKLSQIFDFIPRYFRTSSLTSADFNSDLHSLIKTNPGITAGWLMQRLGEKYRIQSDQLKSAMIAAVKQLKSSGQIEVRPGPRHNTFVYFPIEKRSASLAFPVMDPNLRQVIRNIGVFVHDIEEVPNEGTYYLLGNKGGGFLTYAQEKKLKEMSVKYHYIYGSQNKHQWHGIYILVPFSEGATSLSITPQDIPGHPNLPSSLDESGKSWRDRPPLASRLAGKIEVQRELNKQYVNWQNTPIKDAHIVRMVLDCLDPRGLGNLSFEGLESLSEESQHEMVDVYQELNHIYGNWAGLGKKRWPDIGDLIYTLIRILYRKPVQSPPPNTPNMPNLPSSLDESGKSWRDRPPLANRR